MKRKLSLLVRAAALLAVAAASMAYAEQASPGPAAARQEVMATEQAFAKTMADRDFKAFVSFVADDAVFFSGPQPARGREAVADVWKRHFDKPDAPFSWVPERVEVLDSGTLALSTGPVYDPSGKKVATFTSVWRRESSGVWRIIFDKGDVLCNCAAQAPASGS